LVARKIRNCKGNFAEVSAVALAEAGGAFIRPVSVRAKFERMI